MQTKISELEKGQDFKVNVKSVGEIYLTVATIQNVPGRILVYSHSTGNTLKLKPDYEVEKVSKIPTGYLKKYKKIAKKENRNI